jgi:carbon monoxide dehydrogenase subunit G
VELKHTFTVPAPVETAWATLLDVEGIAPCFPGAALTSVEGDEFAGTVKVKLGPVSLQYAGKGRFVERDEAARRVVLEANGSDKRGNGTAGATVHARLEPAGEDRTTVVVETDLKVTGRPAQFGRGVLQDVGGRIIEQFATCLATRMAPEEPAAEPAPEPAAAPAGDSAADPAGDPPGGSAGTAVAASSPRSVPQQQAAAELDLGSVVLPSLVRRFGPVLVAGLLGLVIGRLLGRRRA